MDDDLRPQQLRYSSRRPLPSRLSWRGLVGTPTPDDCPATIWIVEASPAVCWPSTGSERRTRIVSVARRRLRYSSAWVSPRYQSQAAPASGALVTAIGATDFAMAMTPALVQLGHPFRGNAIASEELAGRVLSVGYVLLPRREKRSWAAASGWSDFVRGAPSGRRTMPRSAAVVPGNPRLGPKDSWANRVAGLVVPSSAR